MAEVFRDMREEDTRRRRANFAKADPTGWRQPQEYHWQRELLGDIVDYWPTKNKWRWRKRTYHGDVGAFIRNKEKLT